MDDRTVGLVLRALRRRRGWRQSDLASRSGYSQTLISEIERGQLQNKTLEVLRRVFGAVEGRVTVEPRWRGAEADRLIDADHAAIVEAFARRLVATGWVAHVEVTYSVGPERGSIDVLGVNPARRAALVAEIKSDLPSSESAGRKLDEKRRLAPAIVHSRLGWTPEVVATILVLPESPRLRRLLAGAAAPLARMFPVASRAVGAWLRRPDHPMAATWFLSDTAVRNTRRVRRPSSRTANRTDERASPTPSTAAHDSKAPPRILR